MKISYVLIGAALAEYDDLGNKKTPIFDKFVDNFNEFWDKNKGKNTPTCVDTHTATCDMGRHQGDDSISKSDVSGVLTLTQSQCDDGSSTVKITGNLDAADAVFSGSASNPIHVHTYGAMYTGKLYDCGAATTGGHFLDDAGVDIGATLANLPYENGAINVDISSSDLSIVGADEGYSGRRSLVMHLNSGDRVACCTIQEPEEIAQVATNCEDVQEATCDFQGQANGKITLTEQNCGGSTQVRFTGSLDCPTCNNHAMGFHVHGSGTITDGDGNLDCGATGGHFSYGDQIHGLPDDAMTNNDGAHYGALGNVYKTVDNRINVDVISDRISLTGENNGVANLGMVLHADNDKGVDFQSSGDSGPRLACCKISEAVSSPGNFCGVNLKTHFNVDDSYDFSECNEDKSKCKVKCAAGGKPSPKKLKCKNGNISANSISGC